MIKNLVKTIVLIACFFVFGACHDRQTYADQKKREREAIAQFLVSNNIKIISEKQFVEQDSTTNIANNEFVEFKNTGIYMQIVRRGIGDILKDGSATTVLCRFDEYNILTDSLQLSNNVLIYGGDYDKLFVTNNGGTYKATFVSGVMMSWYNSASVPAGWLTPLPYIRLGFPDPTKPEDEIPKVRLIVPHTQGHSKASAGVYPCYYEITYQKMR